MRSVIGPALALCLLVSGAALAGQRLILNFNPDWRFIKADPPVPQQPGFDDREWAGVSAPHTYNDIDTFDNWSIPGHRGEQNQWGGRTWYRKTFTLPESCEGKKVYHRVRGGPPGRRGVSQRPTARREQDGLHALRIRPDAASAVRRDRQRPGGDVRQPLHEGPTAGREWHATRTWPSCRPRSTRPSRRTSTRSGPTRSRGTIRTGTRPTAASIRNVRLHVTDPLHISLPLYSFLADRRTLCLCDGVSREVGPRRRGSAGGERAHVRGERQSAGRGLRCRRHAPCWC